MTKTREEHKHKAVITHRIYPGYPLPLGVHLHDDGAQFALMSRNATSVQLLLFSKSLDLEPYQVINLDPTLYHTGDIWHVWVEGVGAGQVYAYRVDGPYEPQEGFRYNKHRVILDPYATALSTYPKWNFDQARGYDLASTSKDLSFSTKDNISSIPKCIVTGNRFDWGDDTPPKIPWSRTIIYETHVKGLTAHRSSGVAHPGTFGGVIEKIPYLKKLGITAVEFLPVQEFSEHEMDSSNPLTGKPLVNYWGYSTISFFAPKATYFHNGRENGQVDEFKEMVKALHEAGIEIILDIVFNHTAEGNHLGPTISFRGLDNTIWYILEEDRRYYRNYTGCGNTFNCNHPVVRQFIIDCLTYWVIKMHVDGFRFDLASIMGRDENGEIMNNPPLLSEIAENPILRDIKLIAEAWDAAGAYQVGSFHGHRWSEWNGRYRDDVRRFWRGDPGMIGMFASRISGSADIYQKAGKEPLNSINFITCHDGFTLNDLVSYNEKHNEANGEGNRDGSNDNFSYNYGVEGPTEDAEVEAIRIRQIKNFIATLFISRGVPLFLGGDEFRRTQCGNNNAFCQDNETSWYDWSEIDKNEEVIRFTRQLIAFRERHPILREVKFYADQEITWYSPELTSPDWGDECRTLACMIHGENKLFLMVNAGFSDRLFFVPEAPHGTSWHWAIDTSKRPPNDICTHTHGRRLECRQNLVLSMRSLAILIAV